MSFDDQDWFDQIGINRRFFVGSVLVTLIFLLLLLRLWYLQVVSYDQLHERSIRNRTRLLSLDAPRGPVYDRHGTLLVDNRPCYQISVLRQDVIDRQQLFERLALILNCSVEELEQRWRDGSKRPPYQPVLLADDVSWETMVAVQEQAVDLPGLLTEVKPIRQYQDLGDSAHLLGYLGEITVDELQQDNFSDYRGGDLIGKAALEKAFEPYLRGQRGTRLVEVDVRGKLLRQLRLEPPQPGNKIYLTIDSELQRVANEAFADQAGAAVAIDIKNGDLLAMVSRPTFNPALFVQGLASEQWAELQQDPRHPLQNKAIAGQYPPGSTFKMIVALAALRAGTASAATVVDCNGAFSIGDARYRCWKRYGHGATDLEKALRESCDVWFYKVGLDLGIDKLSAAAREFGLGSPVGFPLPGERSGNMPSQQWKRAQMNKPWYAGETVIASIGQGYVLATPLQLAAMTATIASKGMVIKPRVVERVEDWQGNLLFQQTPEVVRQVDFPASAWDAVHQGMFEVVNHTNGTGNAGALETVQVAGKTGTSQVVRRRSDAEEAAGLDGKIPYRLRPHALYVAFAPLEDPQIAVAVVVEHGESGGRAAGPIAAAMIENWLQRQQRSETEEP